MFERVKPLELILAEAGATEAGLAGADPLEPTHTLKKTLGPISLMAMGIGAIIGTGIFVLTGVAAAKYTGPSLTVSFIIAGFVSVFAAMCYSEVVSRVPIAGSAYTFTYTSLGERFAWIIGWALVLEYALGASTVSVGWSGYFTTLMSHIGWQIPVAFTHNPWDTGPSGEALHGIMNLPAFLVICLIGTLLYRGTQESAMVNNIIVTLKVCVVLFFIVIGVGHVNQGNWTPYFPFGWGGTLFGAFFVFFAYIGFDAVSTAAEESVNPKRDMPIGIIGSLAICTVLYIIVAAILTGIVSYTHLNVPQPVAFAIDQIPGMGWASALISVGAIAGLTTVLLVMMFGQIRVFYAMSRDGLLPPIFAKLHPKFRTPGLSTVLFTIFIAFLGAFTPISLLGSLTNMGTLAAFIFVAIAVPILRTRYPSTTGFNVPFGKYFIPIVSAVSAFALIVLGPLLSTGIGKVFGIPFPWVGFIVWLLIGLPIYYLYGRKHSKLAGS